MEARDKIAAQHAKGKLTARERIDLLIDPGTFLEIDKYVTHRGDTESQKFQGDGVITGFGRVGGRQVFVYVYDFTILGGSLGEMAGRKVVKVMEHALRVGAPLIGIIDSGGARIQEGGTQPRRIRGYILSQYTGFRLYTSDYCKHRPMCWWRCILACYDRFCYYGRKCRANVRYGPRSRKGGLKPRRLI